MGFSTYWPMASGNSIGEQARRSIELQFAQDRYNKPELIKQIQFVVCWAHSYTEDWDEWQTVLRTSAETAKQYDRPMYADMTVEYHPEAKTTVGIVEGKRLVWMVGEAYNEGFDGVIIRSHKMPKLETEHYEAALSVLNRINE
jgi:hypothetical protein